MRNDCQHHETQMGIRLESWELDPKWVLYTYDGSKFNLTSSERGGVADRTPAPIKILAEASNDTRSYKLDVDLPADTDLSTNDGVERGYPVPIRAFVDNDDDGKADEVTIDGNTIAAENVTIDRVYVGYLKLVKESRILKGDGPDIEAGQDTFSNTPKSPRPGNIIEYKIDYKNISEEAGGPGYVVLNAKKVEITEDGTDNTVGNNWAKDNDGDGEMDTINVAGQSVAADATITFTPAADDKNVTAYTVKAEVAPGVTKTFTFQRRVNKVSPTGTANNGTGGTGNTGNPGNI
ncbi:MAG: hypothetical protein MJK14_17405 [Rivularia sp. ALOHA_DT_140]|nr:hypothetical protein [Rivularia sp. ALOHA_DT_140]